MTWLLQRLEQNPRAVFTEHELRTRDSGAFDQLRQERLLRRLRIANSYPDPHSRRVLTVVENPDGSFEAFDEDDPEFDAVPVSSAELAQWMLDLDTCAVRIRDSNGLHGTVGMITPRLLFLGTGQQHIGLVLGLLNTADDARVSLMALRDLAPRGHHGFVVLTPHFLPSPDLQQLLDAQHIHVSRLNQGEPWEVLSVHALAGIQRLSSGRMNEEFSDQTNEFRHGPDFRQVWLRGQLFDLTALQAAVIRILWVAYRNNTPSVSTSYLLEEAGSGGSDLRDVFKRVPFWDQLIVIGTSKGTVRLNL